jgi:hypothetical protein
MTLERVLRWREGLLSHRFLGVPRCREVEGRWAARWWRITRIISSQSQFNWAYSLSRVVAATNLKKLARASFLSKAFANFVETSHDCFGHDLARITVLN